MNHIDLHSFGILHSVELQFLTDVSGQPIGPHLQESSLKMGQVGCPKRRQEGTVLRCVKLKENGSL